uniref:Transposase n=1 Tax=Globodera rostochiensis TaxID=31243 RepID=A0A914GTN8_GLORO
MRDWINRIDGKTTYTTDGTIVYCQPCQQQVENQPFSSRQQQQQDNENNLQKMDELKKEFSGKQIWASVDETTDKKGRYVANLIIGVF